MALCLATSLVERGAFDPADQMRHYVRWRREGYLSATGHCFDIGYGERVIPPRWRDKVVFRGRILKPR